MEGHMKELCRVIKYAIDTKDRGLKLQPEETDNKWKLKAYSDADFTGDKETQISVRGYIIYFMNGAHMDRKGLHYPQQKQNT